MMSKTSFRVSRISSLLYTSYHVLDACNARSTPLFCFAHAQNVLQCSTCNVTNLFACCYHDDHSNAFTFFHRFHTLLLDNYALQPPLHTCLEFENRISSRQIRPDVCGIPLTVLAYCCLKASVSKKSSALPCFTHPREIGGCCESGDCAVHHAGGSLE